MKTKISVSILLLLVAVGVSVQATQTNTVNLTPDVAIPVGSPIGVTEQFTISGATGVVSDVSVTLNIAGGFNGNLYAYLENPEGQLAVLLNRVGVTASNPFGYSNPGFDITLDGNAASNIHGYGSSYSVNGSGQVAGTWAADGRNISPMSAGSLFDSAATTSGLNIFVDTAASGVWTLFVADLSSGGGTADLNDVGITVMTAPEPGTWVLLGGGLAALVVRVRRKDKADCTNHKIWNS